MKLTLLILGFLSLTACSSLITRGNLRDCEAQCKAKDSCMMHVSKHEGQLNCECSLSKAEKEAMDKEIKELEAELDKMEKADEVKPVEIPASEQEIVPAPAEKLTEEVPVLDQKKEEQIPEIKSETVPAEETPITVDEVKPEAPAVTDPAPVPDQK